MKSTFSTACLFTVLAITYNRFLGICFPMNIYSKWRATSVRRINTAIWIVAVLVGFPEGFSFNQADIIDSSQELMTVCFSPMHQTFQRSYYSICSCLFLVAFLVSVYCMMRMTIALCKSRSRARRHRKSISLLVAVVVVFLLCLLPYRMMTLLISLAPTTFVKRLQDKCCVNLLELFGILSLLYNALNPMIYNFLSRRFNNAFFYLLYDGACCKNDHFRKRSNTYRGQYRHRSATCQSQFRQRSGTCHSQFLQRSGTCHSQFRERSGTFHSQFRQRSGTCHSQFRSRCDTGQTLVLPIDEES